MRSASFHGPITSPVPQLGLTSEITAADGSPNGPDGAGTALSPVALLHENRQAITPKQMILFTTLI